MAKLGEVFTIASGGTPDKGNPFYYENGTIPWVKTCDLKNQYVPTGIDCITEEGLNNSPAKLFPPNTVLVAMYGATIGACSILSYEAATNQACAAFLPNENVLPTYLYYFLLSKRDQFVKDGVGGAQPNISAGYLKNVQFDLVPVRQQEVIVERLDKIENLIALRKQQLQKLDELVKARFVELFGDCLSNPKGWKTKCLEDIAEVGSSKRVFVEELREDGIPFFRGTEVGALAEGKQITPELFITEQHYAELCKATGTPRIGDLLMPSICPDGRIWLVNTDKPFYFKDGRVLWVHAIDTSYNPVFLLYTLKDRIMTDYSSIASGTTFAELKIFALKKCQVFDVPITLQNEFAAFVKQTDKSKVVVQKALDEAQLLFDSLMQQYFG